MALVIIVCIGAACVFAVNRFHLLRKDTSGAASAKPAASVSAGSKNGSKAEQSSESSASGESAVSLQNAAKPLWIAVSIAKQNVTVYDADNKVVESFICSTGSPGHDTPTGTFSVYNRGKSFFSKKYQEGGYYWVAFYEDYYFHSVPFDKNGQIITKVANDLGRKDSHGCVHLSIPNSEWIYDNIPNKTKVVIE